MKVISIHDSAVGIVFIPLTLHIHIHVMRNMCKIYRDNRFFILFICSSAKRSQ